MGRSSESLAAVTAEIELARGVDGRFDDAVKRLSAELGDPDAAAAAGAPDRRPARAVPAGLAAAPARPGAVADAFCATRLGGDWGAVLGTLPAGPPTSRRWSDAHRSDAC